MDYKKEIQAFLKYSFDEFPSSEYLPDAIVENKRGVPRFHYMKDFDPPKAGLFTRVEIIRFAFTAQKNISFEAPNFGIAQWKDLDIFLEGLNHIVGADDRRRLYLRDQEEDEFLLGEWEGRGWNFPKYDEIMDMSLDYSKESGFSLTFWEKEFKLDDDDVDDSWLLDGWVPGG